MEKAIYLIKAIFTIALVFGFSSLETAGSEEVKKNPRPPQGMVGIPSGELFRGSDSNQGYQICLMNNRDCKKSWFQDEEPANTVRLNGFYIDSHEVTQKEFQRVMGDNPSVYKGSNFPVERVTWSEATEFCERVGKRLPTEAEWEWAARGGQRSVFPWGDKAESRKANFCDKQCDKRWKESQFDDDYRYTAPVGSFPANGYGAFDMAGNVYEWVTDWYAEDYYEKSPRDNPKGPETGKRKVIRGGSWINYSTGVRPAERTEAKPAARLNFVGFRCAL
ncbi:MAG: SUMF1/EgtB/PvdO family nonheme iron enzyme [Nitrospinae bacterium]|nr:SUMF1/EgtB/PvdO family nonheme iron enzyme [Nitrospinota bacterium]MDA1110181.1 SUMF1/EgtB/PvdO family nonheme iron enzyme [Nitrospinota bacterium]